MADKGAQTLACDNMGASIRRIQTLNDHFRRTMLGGRYVLTIGVRSLSQVDLAAVLQKIRTYDSFDTACDPHGEHDFGSIEQNGQKIFWKIDCYDKALEFYSPDPTDSKVTSRVLTVMLAEEY